MLELIKPGTKIDFVRRIKPFFIVSAVVFVICLGIVFGKGFNHGIDFAGGTVIQVKFNQPVQLEEVRQALAPVIGHDFLLQNFGENDEVLIRIVQNPDISLRTLSEQISSELNTAFAGMEPDIMRTEQVGPQVGGELKRKAYLAILFAGIGILLYIAIRFRFLFGISAIIALIFDTFFTLGIYSLSGKEFNITVMAAVFTAVGYSLNDKIVVFDRIREKLKSGLLNELSWKELVNKSINECLSRTIITSLLTFLAVLSLYIFGGEVLNGFALVMMVGIVIGTVSSITVGSMFVYLLYNEMYSKAVKSGKKQAPLDIHRGA